MCMFWEDPALTKKRVDQRHVVIHVHVMLAGPIIDRCEVVTAMLGMEMGQRLPVVINPVISREGDVSFAHQNHADI